uniref:Uncharacterized protein n=1 Tax=Alexandrium andersonii TaxID=327968 RepID=A0A7S2IW58_9DINO
MSTLLLALLAMLGCVQGTDDHTALLQAFVKEGEDMEGVFDPFKYAQNMLKLPHKPCDCLWWSDLYASKKVACGDALEANQTAGICKDFPFFEDSALFPIMSHPFCVNIDVSKNENKATKGTWCYVDSKCSSLNGGKQVNADVSYKVCSPLKDKSLGDISPNYLFSMGLYMQEKAIHEGKKKFGISFPTLAMAAYDWAGLPEHFISLKEQDIKVGRKAVVGASSEHETWQSNLQVMYKKEVWEVSTSPKCVSGCKGYLKYGVDNKWKFYFNNTD